MEPQQTIQRGDGLARARRYEEALGLYLQAAEAFEVPAGDLCLKIARCAERAHRPELAWAWLPRVVDASSSFLEWSAAASLLARLQTQGRPPARRSLRLALTGSYTTSQLGAMLRLAALREGIDVILFESAFNQYRQDLSDPGSGLYAFSPEAIVIAAHHGAVELPAFSEAPEEAVRGEAARWRSLWRTAGERCGALVVQHLIALPLEAPLGHLTSKVAGARYAMIQRLNSLLGEAAGDRVLLVDCDRLAAAMGKAAWFDDRYWFAARQAVGLDAVPLLARHTVAVLAAALGLNRKCLVLDLDNTLWGGVIGEDGLDGIQLGSGAQGEAFVAFQEYVLELKRRGVILAVASKNNEADARAVFLRHPDMRIRLGDLAAFICNWEDKPSNLRRVAAQLNLGLDALTLADDNPAERALVRAVLPQVDVIALPAEPSGYVRALAGYLRFEPAALTAEDRSRTEQYRARAAAAELESSSGGIEGFYRSLQMEARVKAFDDFHLPRIAQLVNKTNQFNLTTRRYSLEQLRAMARDPSVLHLYLELRDRFGDHGLVSVLIARRAASTLEIDTWLMSCRVIGRTVEAEMMARLCALAQSAGISRIRGTYVPSEKNVLVKDLYQNFGFVQVREGDGVTTWEYDLQARGPIRNGFIADWVESDDAA